MAEWLVEITKELSHMEGESVPAGQTISATRTQKDGEVYSYLVVCPKCGLIGDVRVNGGAWSAKEENGNLTLHPSILCQCGCHTFVTDGVMKEV